MATIEYGKVQIFDDLVPVQLYRDLLQAMQRVGWQFGWRSPTSVTNRYWHHEVGYGPKDGTEDISENVRKHPLPVFAAYQDWLRSQLVPADTRILRYYLNAHTYGTDGSAHTDTERGEELTSVLYLTPQWKPAWCGETVVFDQNGDIAASALPKANRLLIFPSDRLHAPRPLAKEFSGLRVVLVVKMGTPSGLGKEFTRIGAG